MLFRSRGIKDEEPTQEAFTAAAVRSEDILKLYRTNLGCVCEQGSAGDCMHATAIHERKGACVYVCVCGSGDFTRIPVRQTNDPRLLLLQFVHLCVWPLIFHYISSSH